MVPKKTIAIGVIAVTAAIALSFNSFSGQASSIKLDMKEVNWEIKPGLTTKVWSYGGTVPGTPIIIKKGETVNVTGVNNLPSATTIHWHGLVIPNDQDGPGKTIKPGEKYSYSFKVNESGTYWYHSHYRPVLDQVDNGLYAPIIVKAPEDEKYSGDHIYIIDDWYLDSNGNRLSGTARGEMERFGNIETVNGKSGSAIEPLAVKKGQLHKLRFINASTAAVHTIKISGHRFRVTHTDGHALPSPYESDVLTLSPGERIDAEVAAIGDVGQVYAIESDRPELGLIIPIKYQDGQVNLVASPFVPPQAKGFAGIESRTPDFTLDLNSVMEMPSHNNMAPASPAVGHASHGNSTPPAAPINSHGGHGAPAQAVTSEMQMQGSMRWTINGQSYPNVPPLEVKLGQIVKVRIVNNDISTAEKMDHPIHIHGTEFQIVSQNGKAPARETWKDTINVPAGEYVDIAFTMTNPGTWMLHCHILDHEDGGMMTTVVAK
ncbi:multicopper oxidase family protein [Sporomusa acidovorans]|uniref:multicopper oxidase family protein n=1 Tax=Sporomusa acidovorans TaxID=112900 RepID=UPI00088D91CE|nr:multicopper oxidase family protein [Sporomusa acidovorans]OZC18993.1 blue copper oxidase CueO precursor [Sporomusa acidovorans DSM 3132]SDD72355.1 Multicopper oxidase with three cupredoxin domains (includes cell division protein FtsP and spore coat protein CotA) [Sporomusa acidovorans]